MKSQKKPHPRRKSPEQIVVGRHPVRELLEREDVSIEKVYLQKGSEARLHTIRGLAANAGVPVQVVPVSKLRQMAGNVPHQGVVAVVAPVQYQEVEELLDAIAATPDEVREKKPVLVMLDEIQDPHNFGAILRSAVAAGAAGVIVPMHRMAPVSATTVKASAGTALRIPIARAKNLVDVIHQLKERGYWVIGLAGEGETSVWEMDWDRPLVLVIGSEGKGLRPRVRDACDMLVRIPMRGPAESLNASVAAGIALFAATRARTASDETNENA